jgi:3-carboxy-cis,cis-muconate cycloisomerase
MKSPQAATEPSAFEEAKTIAHALDFEVALAHGCAASGLITTAHAAAIESARQKLDLDPDETMEAARHAGTLAIAIVDRLRAAADAELRGAGKSVHLGATSQDLADTVLVLQMRHAAETLDHLANGISGHLAQLAKRHISTTMIGRTLLQQATPITFGLKAANWMLGVDDAATRLRREIGDACVLQFGGASGTLATLGVDSKSVAEHLSQNLGLPLPTMPWHSRRGNIAGVAAAIAILGGANAKIADDIALLAQNEVSEATEPVQRGRGGSSAMAHKQNPVGCQQALTALATVPALAGTLMSGLGHQHERGLWGWQAERSTLVQLFTQCKIALAALTPVLAGLVVDAPRMAENLKTSGRGNDIGHAGDFVRRALGIL